MFLGLTQSSYWNDLHDLTPVDIADTCVPPLAPLPCPPFVLTHPGCVQSSGRAELLGIVDFAALFDLRTFTHAVVLRQLTPYSQTSW